MFITSIKLTKQKMIGAVVIAGLLLVGLIVWIASSGGSNNVEPVGNLPSTRNIRTERDRVDFLNAAGWQVSDVGAQSQEVLIPSVFDEVFERYNEMQKVDGFDLSQYKNRRVMRHTFMVTNHPIESEEVVVTLLVYRNRIIGGDLSSVNHEGFMHGLYGTQNVLPGTNPLPVLEEDDYPAAEEPNEDGPDKETSEQQDDEQEPEE